MENIKKQKKISNRSLNILLFMILLYVILDGRTSANVNINVGNRIYTHILLFLILLYTSSINSLIYLINGIRINFINMLLFNLTTWILVVGLLNGSEIWFIFVHTGLSFLWLMLYEFMSNLSWDQKTKTSLKKWILCIMAIFLVQFVKSFYSYRLFDNRVPVLNIIYYFLSLLPWVPLLFSKRTANLMYFILMLLVVLSSKRGAILISPLMIIANKKREKKFDLKKIMLYFISTLLIFLFSGMFNRLSGNFLTSRFERDNLLSASGRFNLYELSYSEFVNRSLIEKIVGKGAGFSVKYLGTGVHNEWLEFLSSYGYVGTFLYFLVLLSIFTKKKSKLNENYLAGYDMLIVFILTISFFDGLYFMHSSIYIFMYIGVSNALGKENITLT